MSAEELPVLWDAILDGIYDNKSYEDLTPQDIIVKLGLFSVLQFKVSEEMKRLQNISLERVNEFVAQEKPNADANNP